MLHKMILQIAMKCMEVDSATYLSQFLVLGSKASSWCEKHLKEKSGATDELHDTNHSTIFEQILLDGLLFGSNLISVLTSSRAAKEDANMMLITGTLISELLNLTKASVMGNKKICNVSSEVLKVAQQILEGTRTLCLSYSDASKEGTTTNEEKINEKRDLSFTSLTSKIVNYAIQTLYEIGVFAASGGGTYVTMLNLSWKGVVTLLQTNKGALDEKLKVGDIITTLISLALEMLKSAAESWFLVPSKASPSIAEAKRAFLPIKFFLINAVRICSAYPLEALVVQREIVSCALAVSNLGFCFNIESQLRAVREALAEFVEPTSFLLLQAVISSVAMDPSAKCEVFECLLQTKRQVGFLTTEESDMLASAFSTGCDASLPGGVLLFLNILRVAPSLGESTTLELCKYLGNLFTVLIHEKIYPFVLGSEIPILGNSNPTPEITWQPMHTFVVQTLKAFLIFVVTSSSVVAWLEAETILLENLFHTHFLCVAIATELLSFVIRHAETALAYQIIENTLSLVRIVAPHGLRPRTACSFNSLLSCASSGIVDRIFTLVSNDEKSGIYLALLREGFPFGSLSDNVQKIAIERLFTAISEFMEAYCREKGGSDARLIGFPVHALASALVFCDLKDQEIFDEKTSSLLFKFTSTLIQNYKSAPDNRIMDSLAKLISSSVDIISKTKQLYGYPEMSGLFKDLNSLFTPKSNSNTTFLPSLGRFIAGLCHMEIPEGDENSVCTALWNLNHTMLRERHWAVAHQAVAAFGHFAAHTTCTQLWQFVPDDPALSYDVETGTVTDANRFMSELKASLEKEVALNAAGYSGEEFGFLIKEGESLQKMVKTSTSAVVPMEICEEAPETKKRKIPEGFSEGVELLQRGLKVMRGALDQNDLAELGNEISSQMACIEKVISHLVCLSDL
ncbi:holliday junction resolvase [Rhynchospora pubera]|uniref:Holliday junction resolvase n=1 Tax=Rhynchospora pubera TaxID=906938 RepID=A0AAV8GCP3_9POAL|nr:holliday junction resolvase [Rhynchospora pubera]